MIIQSKDAITDINSLYITTQSGQSVSIGAVAELVPSSGPTNLPHYNKMRSVILSTDIPQGMPLNKAMSLFKQQLDASLPEQLEKYWTGKSKALKKGLTEAAVLFVLSLIFIYAIMAIQFESFLDPFIILLTVPFACFGGLLFVWLSGGAFNIYTQIGLVTLIGLITKHGILIVSFVNQQSQNIPLVDRILQAASLRLRPILMTSGAMVMGTIPLIISTDMGHESRQAIGIVLLGGLVVGTVLTLFVLPSLCYSLKGRRE
jgi:multidrug efflux pump